jgi:hypothetical protein
MTDREMLDLLAGEAPVPRPGYVDEIAEHGRRARRRRRRLTAGGAGLGVAAVLASVVLATQLPRARPDAAAGPAGSVSSTVSSATPGADRVRSAEAEAYAAAVRALADEVREGGPPWPVLFVLDHTCADVVTPPPGGCDPVPLTAALRDDLTEALRSYAPVRFVADQAPVTDVEHGLVVIDGGVVVTLGPVRMDGDRAEVPLSVRRSGLNGRGQTYVLSRQGTAWRIDGVTGPTWIS